MIHQSRAAALAALGGGVAGLVAAWTLRRRGVDVVVLEYEEEAGGKEKKGAKKDEG